MFINMNLGDTVEPKPVPQGRYDVVVTSATFNGEKNYIRCSLGIQGHLDAPNVNHFISLPKKDDEPQKANFKQLMLKRFLEQFNIPYDPVAGFNVEDFNGAAANVQLNISEPDDTGTVYNELVVDKMTDEPIKAPTKPRKA